ncbi:MAG: ribonuclease P protein component [Proteobacteria bacterium]|nr:MAG: ribonuclease P protein component [Pseudomonadota bacterium]
MLRAVSASRFLQVESNSAVALKRSSDFLSLKKNGKRVSPTRWLLLNFAKSEGALEYGTTASRKVGNAVVRNKLKRWVREYFRDLAKSGSPFEVRINIIFRPFDQGFFRGLSHDEFNRAMDSGIQSLKKYL